MKQLDAKIAGAKARHANRYLAFDDSIQALSESKQKAAAINIEQVG